MASILDIFRALADPTRLRIIYLLRSMELAVGEIAQVVGQSQPRVSRHVRILVEAGLAERRKEGSRSEEHTSELQSLMRISYAVFCLKKKKSSTITNHRHKDTNRHLRWSILKNKQN